MKWEQKFPELDLYKVIKPKRGGITVKGALARAEKEIETHRENAMSEIDSELVELTKIAMANEADSASAVYKHASNIVAVAGIFEPSLCMAGQSLCELAHQMNEGKIWDQASVFVHVESIKQMRENPSTDKDAIMSMVKGLRAVTGKVTKKAQTAKKAATK